MRFTAEIHYEDGSYWAAVQELPGCFASGDTLDELIESLRDAIRVHRNDDDVKLQVVAASLESVPVGSVVVGGERQPAPPPSPPPPGVGISETRGAGRRSG
jgi:predicted RNase H-like HicB family nuclease